MDHVYNDIFSKPENEIFKVVFSPDRIYHEEHLNATVSPRYRYNVHEVRNKHDITILKGEVFLDGQFLTHFIRVEYLGSRLVEVARQKQRFVRDQVLCFIRVNPDRSDLAAEARFKLTYSASIGAYQGELWQTLELPAGYYHDIKVKSMIGKDGSINRIPGFSSAFDNLRSLKKIEIAFRENDIDLPFGYQINDENAAWDNNYMRSHEEPRADQPSNSDNTVKDRNYLINFQRGWYIQANDIPAVRYRNAMMDPGNPDNAEDNIIAMRWVLQRELGGNLIYFHQVEIEPGKVEGTHRHIGSEELYYIISGVGIAYMGDDDDPATAQFPTTERDIYGLGVHKVKELPVEQGTVIYTKSGGVHGIRNNGNELLKFVAFGYHCS